MTLRIIIDHERCIGAGVCLVAAPASLHFDGSSRAAVRIKTGHDVAAVRLAAASCPLAAIRLVGDPAVGARSGVAFADD